MRFSGKDIMNMTSPLCTELSYVRILAKQITISYSVIAYGMLTVCVLSGQLFSYIYNKLYQRSYTFSQCKSTISNTTFFFLANAFLMAAQTFTAIDRIILIAHWQVKGAEKVKLYKQITDGLILVLEVWVVGYFLQLLPVLGFAIIRIHGMLVAICKFMVILLLMISPFVRVFEMYFAENSTFGCVAD